MSIEASSSSTVLSVCCNSRLMDCLFRHHDETRLRMVDSLLILQSLGKTGHYNGGERRKNGEGIKSALRRVYSKLTKLLNWE